jgi:cell division protein ZapD
MKTNTLIIFEHPVNEQVRLYLRLEYLFGEFYKNLYKEEMESSKQALSALLKIINVVDRPDLKSKLIQRLMAHSKSLRHLNQSPEVDSNILHSILQQLEQHISFLHEYEGKIGHDLRKNEFLNQIRMHLANPAGACESILPPLNLWLNKSQESRQADLEVWCKPFVKLLKAITLLLKLIRESTQTISAVAKNGYYQQNQDPSLPCELIRISVDSSLDVFPEFSANKHRFMIRFMQLDLYGGRKPKQIQEDVEFFLRCCRV